MRRRAVLFIVLGSLLMLSLVSAIYLNYVMDRLVVMINRPGSVISEPGLSPDSGEPGGEDMGKAIIGGGDREGVQPLLPYSHGVIPGIDTDSGKPLSPGEFTPEREEPGTLGRNDIISGVQKQIEQPIDKKDLVKAGMIVLRRLDWSEIEYLYRTGSKAEISDAELKKIHKVLRSRLNSDEIKVMQELAHKYGKDLGFLSAESL